MTLVLQEPQSIPPQIAPNVTTDYGNPAYNDTLLTLYAYDHPDGGNTAFVACAGNAWNVYFTETRDGDTINIGRDGILMAKKYYFHAPDPQEGRDERTR
jgi:hypothetical protein